MNKLFATTAMVLLTIGVVLASTFQTNLGLRGTDTNGANVDHTTANGGGTNLTVGIDIDPNKAGTEYSGLFSVDSVSTCPVGTGPGTITVYSHQGQPNQNGAYILAYLTINTCHETLVVWSLSVSVVTPGAGFEGSDDVALIHASSGPRPPFVQ